MAYSSVDRSLTSECGQWQRARSNQIWVAPAAAGSLRCFRRNNLFLFDAPNDLAVSEKSAMARTHNAGGHIAIEGGRARRTELRAAAHRKRRDESPLRQGIRKKCRRSRYPHSRTASAGRQYGGVPTIVVPRGEDLVRDEFTPHDACDLWPIGDTLENRGMKYIEAAYGIRIREQSDEHLVRRGAGSGFTRSAGRDSALHQVRVVRAGNTVNRVVD